MKIKKLFMMLGLLTVMHFTIPTESKAAYGDWKVYAAYHHAQRVVKLDKIIYVLSDNGLYSFDTEDTSIETYDKASGLSDNNIFDIVLCEKTKLLVILYQNGNIDLMNASHNVYNMTELKAKALTDKTLNDMYVYDEHVYIATNSGILILDTKRKVFSDFYSFGQKVLSIAIEDNTIIATTEAGIYKGKMADNLLDSKNWRNVSGYRFAKLIQFNDRYYAYQTNKKLLYIDRNSDFHPQTTTESEVYGYCTNGDEIMFFGKDYVTIFDKDNQYRTIKNEKGIVHATMLNGKFWMACDEKGLVGASFDGNKFTENVASIIPNSPARNLFYKLRMKDGRLLAVGGLLEFGGSPRIAFATQYEQGKWTNFDDQSARDGIGGEYYYRNYHDIIQHPQDPTRHFVAARAGVIEYKDYQFKKQYDHTNSSLMSILPNNARASYYVWTSGLCYDKDENLWVLNSQVDTVLHVMKPNGEWKGYYCPEIAGHSMFADLFFDQRGWLYAISHFSSNVNNGGLFVMDMNGTPNQRSDDRSKFIYIFNNQDGKTYHIDQMHCAVEDLNGAIWIGTNLGPFVTYEPKNIFNKDFYFTQCKVPRNDGTNYADYLLSEINVRCIAVDGGNRKWIGTAGNGVYLVNEDGSEILEHFNTENSPLISNTVYSIAIDGSTGEVFFATENGLVSYMSNATDPEETFHKNLVKAYPNPVNPDFAGNVIITGLMRDSDVKIVNAAGKLVKEGKSIGGEFTWNRQTADGKQAASGVYYVLATDSEGTKGVATKFLIVR